MSVFKFLVLWMAVSFLLYQDVCRGQRMSVGVWKVGWVNSSRWKGMNNRTEMKSLWRSRGVENTRMRGRRSVQKLKEPRSILAQIHLSDPLLFWTQQPQVEQGGVSPGRISLFLCFFNVTSQRNSLFYSHKMHNEDD